MPAPAQPTPHNALKSAVRVRMLVALGGHGHSEIVEVEADELDAYVAAGYVEPLN